MLAEFRLSPLLRPRGVEPREWCRGMAGTDETSKRQNVQVIEAALQVVNEECTECTGGGEELDPVKL